MGDLIRMITVRDLEVARRRVQTSRAIVAVHAIASAGFALGLVAAVLPLWTLFLMVLCSLCAIGHVHWLVEDEDTLSHLERTYGPRAVALRRRRRSARIRGISSW